MLLIQVTSPRTNVFEGLSSPCNVKLMSVQWKMNVITIFCSSLQYSFLDNHEQQKATLAVFSPHTTCLHSPMEATAKASTLSCGHFIFDLSSGTVISYQHLGLGENYPSLLFFHLNKGFWIKYSGKIPTLCFLFGRNNSSHSPVFSQAKYKQGIKGGRGKLEIFLQTQRVATVSSQDSCSLWPLWLKFSEGSISQEAPQQLRKKQGQQRLWSQTSWHTTPLFMQQHFLMQSFHVNEKIDLETFRSYLNYLLWSHYFLGKIQMLFQVRFSAG